MTVLAGATGALVATLVVEVPIVTAFYPRLRAPPVALVANAVTNSALNRVWLAFVPWPAFALVSGEVLAFALEALVYARWLRTRSDDVDRAIAASAAANLASFVLGPLVLHALR